jgi:hypothetical protein
MSKLFFDHLIDFREIDKEIKSLAKTQEERDELWALVDELVHHKVIGCILEKLPKQSHEEFLFRLHDSPYDESLMDYLKEKIDTNIEELIRQEIGTLAYDILQEIKDSKK